jgi:3-oxoacyl-[acyl-carrier-protein] synthase-3
MDFSFHNKQIEGVLSVLPEKLYTFEDEVTNPDDPKSKRLKKIIGFGTRRCVKHTTTMSDMLLYGLHKLIDEGCIRADEIGAIVVVTLCQDYMLPLISNIIHGELGLGHEVMCVDMPQACAGYISGLIESFMLLDHMEGKKVLLCTGEILNRKPETDYRTDNPSFGGDVANITIVSNNTTGLNPNIYARMESDGGRRNALLIEYGGFRKPMTPELAANPYISTPCSHVNMDGSGVFNFVQREVPPMIRDMADRNGKTIDDFDYYFFHQPNKFMLQKLATALGIPYEKMPMDITETLGNSDSGTIPVAMTTNASEDLVLNRRLCCLSGFGGGLTWGAVTMNIGPLDFCANVISDL